MKNKINLGLAIGFTFIAILFSSCLKKDLPAYPLWNGNDINNVYVEYRYNGSQTYNEQPVVAYQRLQVNQQIDTIKNTVSLQITVPPASGSFTEEERAKVSKEHLWVYTDISTAATISAVGETPRLGDSADLTKPLTYEVTAANGLKKRWTVLVISFTK